MAVGSEWTLKYGNTKTEVERCYTKTHEGEKSIDRRTTVRENMENEYSKSCPKIGKRHKKWWRSSDDINGERRKLDVEL